MRLPVNDFDKWYSAQGFGNKTSYGYHEGDDLNLKTGGDTDLGQPIIAIANGEVTSVHSHTTKPTFGNHVHISHKGAWGEVYSHAAHCKEILVKAGDKVNEGQVIATVGKSGTDFGHLHFAIKLQPTGIDAIAKTQEDLKKWTDPIPFIQKWSVIKDTMPDYFKTLLQESNLTLENEGAFRAFWDKAKKYDDDIRGLQEQVKSANEALADRALEVSTLTEKNQKLSDQATQAEEQLNQIRSERDSFSWEAQKLEIKITSLAEEIDRLNKELQSFKDKNDLMAYSWIQRFISVFKRG